MGGGHAGLEAAFAAARVGAEVVVVTGRLDTVGQTPCNPSVGGVAKAHLVAEIEALGGFMGRAADACAIHGRVLNLSKGPAVWSTRVQVDKARYGALAQSALARHDGVETIEGLVCAIRFDDPAKPRRATGVELANGTVVNAGAVVITTGTFLGGILHTGDSQTPGGRVGERPATELSASLRALGFRMGRLKTGTPPRLRRDSIDYEGLEAQPSDDPFPRFVAPDEPNQAPPLERVHCHLTSTTEETMSIIAANVGRSPMYSGQIKGVGPRYCPSIEDKVVRFPDRSAHQVFLEPEGLDSDLVYPNGISTSLPHEVQTAMVASIPGLARAEIVRPGYAVEYDAVDARNLCHTLASKDYEGLYFAGQINGTSGYEEAGAQGLLAGANAAAWLFDRPGIQIARDEGYAGVMVDDLVTQGCDEPYRMFTSRAEYRLCLREHNAEHRLIELAYGAGLVDVARYDRARDRLARTDRLVQRLRAGESGDSLEAQGQPPWLVSRAKAEVLYAGYLDRQRREIARIRGEGATELPIDIETDYFALPGLSREQASRLADVRPATTAQAARIPGITPAALMCVWAHARQRARRAESV